MSSADEIQIYLGDAKTHAVVEEQPFPASGLATYVAAYGDAANAQLPVYVHEAALDCIERHAASSPEAEVGGALLGGIYRWQGMLYVRIDAHLPARNAAEKRSSLTFTHETWSQLNDERETRNPSLNMVGWYHTHPNLGVFLSDKDRFIQQNFFSGSQQIALVIDPVSNERAFFHQSGGKILQLPGFYIFGDVSRSSDIDRAIERMKTRPRDYVQCRADSSSQAARITNKIVFTEPCINAYYLLPRWLRKASGIMNSETAPRISIKSLIIWVLLIALFYQILVAPKQCTHTKDYDATVHKRFASTFAQAGDDEEAIREYRRYLTLRQSDTGARRDLLAALARLAQARGGSAYTALSAEVARTRELAAQAAAKREYGQAYDLYSAIIDCNVYVQADVSCRNVLGYLAGKVSTPPTEAERKEVAGCFPDAAKMLKEMDNSTRGKR